MGSRPDRPGDPGRNAADLKDRVEYGTNLAEMGLPTAQFKAISWRAALAA